MNERVAIVFKGFLELSSQEQNELIDAMNDYNKKSYTERCEIRETYKSGRVVIGPTSSVICPCCGR